MKRWTVGLWALLGVYSLTLAGIEVATSQDYVRQFFTDIEGDVPFFAVNTTVSVMLLLGAAVLLVFAVVAAADAPFARDAHPFFVCQAGMFALLAFDDRFLVHEKLSYRLGVRDEFVLAAWVLMEVAILVRLARPRHFSGGSARFFAGGAALFGLMFLVDAFAPDRMMLRLSVEDLLKTWSAAMFFGFSWESARWHLRRHASALAGTTTARTGRRVLVLGEDTRIVLPIVRSLGRAGIEVHLAWSPSDEAVTRSRYLTQLHRAPAHGSDDRVWLENLQSIADSARFDLVIPATESAAFRLQRASPATSVKVPVHLLSTEAFETCADKARTWSLARSLGVPVPRTEIVTPGSGDPDLHAWRMPVALKPLVSVHIKAPLAKRFVRRCAEERDVRTVLARAAAEGETLLLQEWFEGAGVGLEFLALDGRVLFAFQHRRLHETIGYGSTYRQSVAVDPRLLEAVRRLAAAVRYTGVGMAEFRAAEDRFVLLEINPRFWGSLPLAAAAGADFPLFLFQMLVEGREHFPARYKVGVRSRVLFDDVRWMWRALNGRRAPNPAPPDDEGWVMNSIARRRVLVHLARGLLLLDRVDTFAWDDPAPFAAELQRLARVIRTRRHGSPRTQSEVGPTLAAMRERV